MIKVFEAFAGIGTQAMALKNIGLEHEVVAIAEIDKFALKSYEAIHGRVNNLGDITKIENKDIPKHDLFTYSFPCQDISNAGQKKGFAKGSGTRSSLLWECERIIETKKPKYLLMENVKALVNKKNKPYFDEWLKCLENLGYSNYWDVLNAKDYGVPQNRERVFVVSILDDKQGYEFPKKIPLNKTLKDLLEEKVDNAKFLTQEQIDRITFSSYNQNRNRIQEKDYSDTLCARDYKDPKCVKIKQIGKYSTPNRENSSRYRVYDKNGLAPTLTSSRGGNTDPFVMEKRKILIKENTKKGYKVAEDGDGINIGYINSNTRRGRVQKQMSNTVMTGNTLGVYDGCYIRKLTSLECWRLMEISDGDYRKAAEVNSDTQLYKQAGNAIVVDVLEHIFYNLFKPK